MGTKTPPESDFELPEGMGEDYLSQIEGDSQDDSTVSPETTPEASESGFEDLQVVTPSGATYPVLTASEAEYYNDRAERYQKDHKFTSVTDLQDLDRVLSTELILYRYDIWLTNSVDYFGNSVSEKDLLKYNKELTATLINLKKSLGLDKITRDKDKGEDFNAWLTWVKGKAKEFAIMRNEEADMARTLFHEMIGLLQTHYNANEVERDEQGLHADQVIQSIWDDIIPRFKAIDEEFRRREPGTNGPDDEGGQTYWVSRI